MYIVSFITEIPTSDNDILPYMAHNDGRVDYKTLKDHYEGVGANARAVLKADDEIQGLF